MKYLSSAPFSSPAATKGYLANYDTAFKPKPKPTEVTWQACIQCGSPVRPYEVTCPACGYHDQTKEKENST